MNKKTNTKNQSQIIRHSTSIFTFSCALCISSLDEWTRCKDPLPEAHAIFCMALIVFKSGTTLVACKTHNQFTVKHIINSL